MDREVLLERLTSDITAYVLGGELPEDDLAEVIKPEGLDERFADFDRLVNLHFLLDCGVRKFTRELPRRIRRIKTETQRHSRTSHGEIDGKIDWERTYQRRFSESPGNKALFVCENRIEHHAIPENLVLRALLEGIQGALRDTDQYLDADHDWAVPWTTEGLASDVQHLIQHNVHIQDIPRVARHEITPRMLETAHESRRGLYRDAAKLFEQRRAYDEGDPEAIQNLLASTSITPDDIDRLFELHVLFQIIKVIDSLDQPEIGDATLNAIGSGREHVASYDGTRGLRLHYDSSGPDAFTFIPHPDEPAPGSRGDAVHAKAQEVVSTFFGSHTSHSQRPDVFIRATESETPESPQKELASDRFCVVEIKHSTSKQTIRSGITELLQYLAFLRRDDDFVFPEEDFFGTKVNGLLVVDDFPVDADVALPSEQSDLPIRIIQANEIATVVPEMISRIFCE